MQNFEIMPFIFMTDLHAFSLAISVKIQDGDHVQDLEEPAAKAAFIWILGEFGNSIQVQHACSSEVHFTCNWSCKVDPSKMMSFMLLAPYAAIWPSCQNHTCRDSHYV